MHGREVANQREHQLRRDGRHAGNEGDGEEGVEVVRDAQPDPHGGGEPDEPEDEGAAFDEVAERAEEEEAGGVAGLGEGGHVGGLLVCDVEVGGEFVEDGVRVVEVGDGDAGGDCWEEGVSIVTSYHKAVMSTYRT